MTWVAQGVAKPIPDKVLTTDIIFRKNFYILKGTLFFVSLHGE